MSIKTFARRIANARVLFVLETLFLRKCPLRFFIGSQGNWPAPSQRWPTNAPETRRSIRVHWWSVPSQPFHHVRCDVAIKKHRLSHTRTLYGHHYATLYLLSGTGQSFIVHTNTNTHTHEKCDALAMSARDGDQFISVRVGDEHVHM